ncbi:peptidase subunit alpha [Beauveria bassiana D1-5]|uniref:Alpha-MPP n=1 Tax=Beauveria bassiana D1-5 TaxID=1245745 RepID=A0A0A2VNG5_BEABA|nr:peptidase subunit alpha [Beauveria bassiana D1-5]
MDRLAFKSTAARSADDMLERVEALGGNFQCASSRESMMYQAATFNGAVPEAVALLAETVRVPEVTEQEVAEQLETARYEIAEIWSKPELILPELVHTAAYKDNTLGNPLLCPEERLAEIGRDTVLSTLATRRRRRRRRLVAGPNPASRPRPLLLLPLPLRRRRRVAAPPPPFPPRPRAPTPRFPPPPRRPPPPPPHTRPRTTPAASSLPPQPPSLHKTNFTHIHLAFEGLPVASEDIYALATLQTLLGGGGSFSAGGPGKGMYSRLYTHVLNQHGWVESCVAFNHSYTDSGLFGIAASCLPGHTSAMLDVLCQELRALTLEAGFTKLGEAEVQRAKNQLRSSLLMNLESRMVELEDLGRSVQVHGKKVPVREMCAKIEALTVNDLRRVARMVVGGKAGTGSGAPTVVLQEAQAYGLSSHAMTWDQIQDRIDGWKLGRRA